MAPVSRSRSPALPLAAVAALGALPARVRDVGRARRRPQRRVPPGLRPRSRRVHRCLRKDPDNKDAGWASIARRFAPRRITSRAAAASSATGKLEEALMEYQIAAELTPASGDIQTELRSVAYATAQPRSRFARTARRGSRRSSIGAGGAAARRRPARRRHACPTRWCSAKPAPATSSPRIGKFANISIVFDPTYRDQVGVDRPAQRAARPGTHVGDQRDAHVLAA